LASGSGAWLNKLRRLHDDSFHVDWKLHLSGLNEQLHLSGDERLQTAIDDFPPSWFNGDLEAIEPGRWALVISLNPQLGRPEGYDVVETPDAYWRFWRTFNSDYGLWLWGPFFNPLVRVASKALGEELPANFQKFATNRMIFTEVCPYASRSFSLAPNDVARLAESDIGFIISAGFTRILLEQAEPGIVLVNGNPSTGLFDERRKARLDWEEVQYQAAGQRNLHHRQGWYTGPTGSPIAMVGFPFLGRPNSHNGNADYEQLGMRIRDFVSTETTS